MTARNDERHHRRSQHGRDTFMDRVKLAVENLLRGGEENVHFVVGPNRHADK